MTIYRDTEFGLVPVDEEGEVEVPTIATGGGVKTQAGAKARAQQKYQKNLEKVTSQETLENYEFGDGIETFEKFQDAPFSSNVHEHAKAETTELTLGIKDFINGLRWSFTDDPEEKAELIQEHYKVEEDLARMKHFYAPLELATFASKIGKVAPYIATGSVEGALGRTLLSPLAAAEAAVNKVMPIVGKAVSKIPDGRVKDVATKLQDIGSDSRDAYRKLAEHPRVQHARREEHMTDDPYYEPYKATLLGTGVTGAVEGAVQEGSSGEAGAVTNIVANLLGKKYFGAMRGMPNENSDAVNALVDEAVGKGYTLTPGLQLGNRFLQQNEAKLAGAAQQSQVMHRYQLENQSLTNELVWDWLELPPADKGKHLFTPENLSQHRELLQSQYNDITSGSTGIFMPDAIGQLRALQGFYAQSPSMYSEEVLSVINPYIKLFQETRVPTRGPDGKFQKGNFTGQQYQEWSQAIKSDINAAFAAGKPQVAYALKDVEGVMKESLQDGIETYGSKVDANDWADLDKKWYTFNTIEEVGIDAKGDISLENLLNHFMNNDRKAFLENTSITMDPVMGLTKMKAIDTESAQLGGTAVEGLADRGEIPQMTRAKDAVMPLYPLLKHKAYMGKYGPGFGTQGSGTGDPGVYGMALDQGLNIHEGAYGVASDLYTGGRDMVDGYNNWADNLNEDRLAQDIDAFNEYTVQAIQNFLFGEDEQEVIQDQSGAN